MSQNESVLRQFRKTLNLTQGDFADRAGISSGYLCQIEMRVHALGRDAGLSILDAYREEMSDFGITLEDLLRDGRRV